MPGPRSAPNGNRMFTERCGDDDGRTPITGKTALKRGEPIHHTRKPKKVDTITNAMQTHRNNEKQMNEARKPDKKK